MTWSTQGAHYFITSIRIILFGWKEVLKEIGNRDLMQMFDIPVRKT